jgi:hypothetical protein
MVRFDPDPTPTDLQVYEALGRMLPSELTDVALRAGAPTPHLSPDTVPAAKRAQELMDWSRQAQTNRSALIAAVGDGRNLVTPRITYSRLPLPLAPAFFGRESDLQFLDRAWEEPGIAIAVVTALAGVGKSTLLRRWLSRRFSGTFAGARYVYGWSFDQDPRPPDDAAVGFISSTLRWFDASERGTAQEKAIRLAELVRSQRTLIVLDGVQRLQRPPRPDGMASIANDSMKQFLLELADINPRNGLCVVTTRAPIADLHGLDGVRQHQLKDLTAEEGALLLQALGVSGEQAELTATAQEFGGHSLALVLLAGYLCSAARGAASGRVSIHSLFAGTTQEQVAHALRVMDSYREWLSPTASTILDLLSLFDGPADRQALERLRELPLIPGLTDALFVERPRRGALAWLRRRSPAPISGGEWEAALQQLAHARLATVTSDDVPAVSAHPLVRDHRRNQLASQRAPAVHSGHARLYEHFARSAPAFPASLAELEPLYRAIAHGCRAGRPYETLQHVYINRIQRGSEFYATRRLGAIAQNLAALSHFFRNPWRDPLDQLPPGAQAYVLNETGLCLESELRPKEAAEAFGAAQKINERLADRVAAAANASNLSHSLALSGDLRGALDAAEAGIALADRAASERLKLASREDPFAGAKLSVGNDARLIAAQRWRMGTRSDRAAALFLLGRSREAEMEFIQAENIQQLRQRRLPVLYSLPGYRYCELLLAVGRHEEARRRSEMTLGWTRGGLGLGLLDEALHSLSLGWATLLAEPAGEAALSSAEVHFDRALSRFRDAGQRQYLPWGLFGCSELRRRQGRLDAARHFAAEALQISETGKLKTHAVDAWIVRARIELSGEALDPARHALHTARALVEQIGYARWTGELDALALALQ